MNGDVINNLAEYWGLTDARNRVSIAITTYFIPILEGRGHKELHGVKYDAVNEVDQIPQSAWQEVLKLTQFQVCSLYALQLELYILSFAFLSVI